MSRIATVSRVRFTAPDGATVETTISYYDDHPDWPKDPFLRRACGIEYAQIRYAPDGTGRWLHAWCPAMIEYLKTMPGDPGGPLDKWMSAPAPEGSLELPGAGDTTWWPTAAANLPLLDGPGENYPFAPGDAVSVSPRAVTQKMVDTTPPEEVARWGGDARHAAYHFHVEPDESKVVTLAAFSPWATFDPPEAAGQWIRPSMTAPPPEGERPPGEEPHE